MRRLHHGRLSTASKLTNRKLLLELSAHRPACRAEARLWRKTANAVWLTMLVATILAVTVPCIAAPSGALQSAGNVFAWGSNGSGQLGNGTTTNSSTPVQVSNLSGVMAIAGGYYHSLALESDGTVWAWGYNSYGQLGNGSTNSSKTPVQVSGLSGVVSIAAGADHSLAVKSDGTVWAWGWNSNGQLGNGTTTNSSAPVQVSGLSGVVAIAGGWYHSLALKSDGTVWAWGYNGYGELGNGTTNQSTTPVQVSNLSGVMAIVGGWAHSLALKSDGTVWAWGYNSSGQLGNGTTNQSSTTPVQVSNLSGVVAIGGGESHSLALKSDGTVWSWGLNTSGQLGNGTTTNSSTPVQVSNLSGVMAIAGGYYHSLALKSDGTVWAWGYNYYSELGNGTTTNSSAPVQVSSLSGVIAIAGGEFHSLALTGSAAASADAVIFIPGIMGSVLSKTIFDVWGITIGKQYWPGILTDHMALSLYKSDKPDPEIIASDVLRSVTIPIDPPLISYTVHVYDGFLDFLAASGYRPYVFKSSDCDLSQRSGDPQKDPNLFPFPYDWRQPIETNAKTLAGYVSCVRQFQPNAKINLVTHSMGGLVARRYLLDSGGSEINALITIAAPWLGAPQAINVLATGNYFPMAPGLMFPWTLQYIAGSFPGAHELLPSHAYFNLGGDPMGEDASWHFGGDGVIASPSYDYDTYRKVLNQKWGRCFGEDVCPGTNMDNFHNSSSLTNSSLLQDDWSNDPTSVRYYHIYGLQDGGHTIGKIVPKLATSCIIAGQFFCIGLPYYDVLTGQTRGDGTVPMLSASRCKGGDCVANGKGYNAPAATVDCIGIGRDDHLSMLQNPYVHTALTTLLKQANGSSAAVWSVSTCDQPSTSAAAGSTTQSTSVAYNYVTVIGVSILTVSDSSGNSTTAGGVSPGGMVPGVDVYSVGERALQAMIPATGDFTLTFTSEGYPIGIEVRTGDASNTSAAVRYSDLVLAAGVVAKIAFNSGIVDLLHSDVNGDGTFSTAVTPTAQLTGAEAQDTVPPQISFSISGLEPATVQVTAQDAGSGVKTLSYSLDGTHYQPYVDSITVSPAQIPTIYAFADDNAANRATASMTFPPGAMIPNGSSVNFGAQLWHSYASSKINLVATNGAGTLISMVLTGSTDFIKRTNCGSAAMKAGTGCVVSIDYVPTTLGPATATLSIADTAGAPHQVILTGTGADLVLNLTRVPRPIRNSSDLVQTSSTETFSGYLVPMMRERGPMTLACNAGAGVTCTISPNRVSLTDRPVRVVISLGVSEKDGDTQEEPKVRVTAKRLDDDEAVEVPVQVPVKTHE